MSFHIILDTLEAIVSNDKLPRLRWEYEAQNNLFHIPFTGCWYVMFGKQENYCHQGQDFNQNKKEMYRKRKRKYWNKIASIKEEENILNQQRRWILLWNIASKRFIYLLLIKVTCNTKYNRGKVTKLLRKKTKTKWSTWIIPISGQ